MWRIHQSPELIQAMDGYPDQNRTEYPARCYRYCWCQSTCVPHLLMWAEGKRSAAAQIGPPMFIVNIKVIQRTATENIQGGVDRSFSYTPSHNPLNFELIFKSSGICMVLAERVGFEPTWGCPPSDFESAPLWPLRYLSVGAYLNLS